MALEQQFLSSKEYLIESSQGENFEFVDLPIDDDYGPFGDDRYRGVARLPEFDEELADAADPWRNLGLPNVINPNSPVTSIILDFIEREEFPLHAESSYTWSNLLLVATPRDPKGPFTISVYQDFTLCGWLVGQGAEIVACDLVEKYDFGTVVIPIDRLRETPTGLVLEYQHIVPLFVM